MLKANIYFPMSCRCSIETCSDNLSALEENGNQNGRSLPIQTSLRQYTRRNCTEVCIDGHDHCQITAALEPAIGGKAATRCAGCDDVVFGGGRSSLRPKEKPVIPENAKKIQMPIITMVPTAAIRHLEERRLTCRTESLATASASVQGTGGGNAPPRRR